MAGHPSIQMTIEAVIALTKANIELYDIITACTVAVIAVPILTPRNTDNDSNDKNNKSNNDTIMDEPNNSNNNSTTKTIMSSTTAASTNRKKYEFYYLVDPTLEEMKYASMILTMGLMCNWKDVTCWEQQQYVQYYHNNNNNVDNNSSIEMTNTAIDLCFKGCQTLYQFIRRHLSPPIV